MPYKNAQYQNQRIVVGTPSHNQNPRMNLNPHIESLRIDTRMGLSTPSNSNRPIVASASGNSRPFKLSDYQQRPVSDQLGTRPKKHSKGGILRNNNTIDEIHKI